MPAIDVVADANIALKWFHERGEEDVAPARALLEHLRTRTVVLHVLDLTFYEVGNALLRGRAGASPEQVATVLASLRAIAVVLTPGDEDLRLAAELADAHELTLYDATYAAVARRREARLVTLDRAILAAGIGTAPAELVAELPARDH